MVRKMSINLRSQTEKDKNEILGHFVFGYPIFSSDIPDFSEWINWNGWNGPGPHKAYDFIGYLRNDKKFVLGLPKETPVRAVADGVVKSVDIPFDSEKCRSDRYFTNIEIKHETSDGRTLHSHYCHVDPTVEETQIVRKGDIIATLYKDEGKLKGRAVHLHFRLDTDGYETRLNPESVYPDITKYVVDPQGCLYFFQVQGLQEQPELYVANFRILHVNDYTYVEHRNPRD